VLARPFEGALERRPSVPTDKSRSGDSPSVTEKERWRRAKDERQLKDEEASCRSSFFLSFGLTATREKKETSSKTKDVTERKYETDRAYFFFFFFLACAVCDRKRELRSRPS